MPLLINPDDLTAEQIRALEQMIQARVLRMRRRAAGSGGGLPFASDGFGSAFGVTDGLGVPDGGGRGAGYAWQPITVAQFTATGGQAVGGAGSTAALIAFPAADLTVQVNGYITTSGTFDLFPRFIDGANSITVNRQSGATIAVVEISGGVLVKNSTYGAAFVNGAALRVTANGAAVAVYYNDTLITQWTAAVTGSAYTGIRVSSAAVALDNFVAEGI